MGELLNFFNDLFGGFIKPNGKSGAVLKTTFVQYIHISRCEIPCQDCAQNHLRIFKNDNNKPKVGDENHFNCDCEYREVAELPVGSISKMGLNAPDVWIKAYGILPDYYITKKEAMEQYGWNPRRNTIAGKAPGKMLGGDVYHNKDNILPVAEGRIWYECDVDYVSGGRSAKRLYYSNDGLMFFSPDHGKSEFYFII